MASTFELVADHGSCDADRHLTNRSPYKNNFRGVENYTAVLKSKALRRHKDRHNAIGWLLRANWLIATLQSERPA